MNLTQDGKPAKVRSGTTVAQTASNPMLGNIGAMDHRSATDQRRVYAPRVEAESPIAYWPMWETSGTTAACQINPAQNGTYSSDVSGWPVGPGIGDGYTAPYFSGNDHVAIHTAALQAAFDGDEGSAMIWARVGNSGVWIDSTIRIALNLWADDNNQVQLSKTSNDHELWFRYIAGAVSEDMRELNINTMQWYHHAITWSASNDRAIAYRDGRMIVTNTGLGVWAGALNAFATFIGALTAANANPWIGWLAHCAVWDRELPFATIQDLSRA